MQKHQGFPKSEAEPLLLRKIKLKVYQISKEVLIYSREKRKFEIYIKTDLEWCYNYAR